MSVRVFSLLPFVLSIQLVTAQDWYTVFPRLVAGQGFSCDFVITNPGYGIAQNLKLNFFSSDGQPLTVQADSSQFSELVFDLAPGESRALTVRSVQEDEMVTGYAILTLHGWPYVLGTEVMRYQEDGETKTQVGVQQIFPSTHFTFPVKIDLDRKVNSGFALTNGRFPFPFAPMPKEQGFVISLINPAGSIEGRVVKRVGEGQHAAMLLTEFFPELDSFEGCVNVSAAVDFGLVALRLEGMIWSSVMIAPGPLWASFDVTASLDEAAAETEPNDYEGVAQEISTPAKIDGEIGEDFDFDLYKFEAQAGEILTAYVWTGDSDLDSYLTVARPGWDVLSINDQNGLMGTNDSFIQMEIPETGTYLIEVSDYYYFGGGTYDYTLVIYVGMPDSVGEEHPVM